MAPPTYFVYIVRCADGSYYSGVTTDLQTRVSTHNSGQGAAWTAARRPVVLVYHEPALGERRALARERQIKGWSREKKEALILGNLDRLRQLSRRRSKNV